VEKNFRQEDMWQKFLAHYHSILSSSQDQKTIRWRGRKPEIVDAQEHN
jgi:hypothetical protein